MFELDSKNIEKIRENLFKKIGENEFFIKFVKNKKSLKVYLKIPVWLEKEIFKHHGLKVTEKLFGGSNNRAEFYRGTILDSNIDDINLDLLYCWYRNTISINTCILRLKDASKGLVLTSTEKIPLVSERILKESIKQLSKNLKEVIAKLKTTIDITKEVKV